ncbi:unnamed protein product [Urochloa humidicola]
MAIVDLGSSQLQLKAEEEEAMAAEQQQEEEAEAGEVSYRRSSMLMKCVRHLCDSGITKLPDSYVLPLPDRPLADDLAAAAAGRVKLPVVDVSLLRDRDPSRRAAAVAALDAACSEYGFFQAVNHGVDCGAGKMLEVAARFFALPAAEKERFMSPDVRAPVRYGTSFNQARDKVLCWRDFLKLACHRPLPPSHVASTWPDQPGDLRDVASGYAAASHGVFMELMEAALEALGVDGGGGVMGELGAAASQMMTVNWYPACPEPELTLGMPAHSDYGLFTLLLQDKVEGLQVMHDGRWLTVDPIPGSFVVNVGDHLEIYSNGLYKSVLHRVRVNSTRPRISVASFHSLPAERVVGPAPELVDEAAGKPPRYMDTDFATFLAYLASADGKDKTFLQSRMLHASSLASLAS